AVRDYLDPTIQALKAVPSLAWVPLFILWFGIFETSKVLLIAAGVFFPVYLNFMAGIQGVDRKLVEVGQVNNLGRLELVL
ncbi:ABC transporter permease subunit, partial [Acinetobacter baumannii]